MKYTFDNFLQLELPVFSLYGQFLTAFSTPSFYNITAAFCAHPLKKTMRPLALLVMWAECRVCHDDLLLYVEEPKIPSFLN